MSETEHPTPNDPPDDSREDIPDDETSPAPETSNPTGEEATEPSGRSDPAEEPAAASTDPAEAQPAGGRRVTRRTVNRREVSEHTQETITEDIPLTAYQGPGSAHPAPVG